MFRYSSEKLLVQTRRMKIKLRTVIQYASKVRVL